MKTSSALSYFGSDGEVADKLAAMLDGCQHVTIPFVGGCSILPHLKARAVVANDLNSLAINFYRHASGAIGSESQSLLIERCEKTLSHPDEMDHAWSLMRNPLCVGTWQQAWAYWAICWIGRKGKGGTGSLGGAPSVRWTPEGGTNATRIRAAASDLREWAKTFERCEWTCLDFRDVLAKVKDDPRCAVYADPPWVGAGDAYAHAFTAKDHIDLRNCLSRLGQAKVVVRYGDSPIIRELYEGWTVIEAAARTQANKQLGEIWLTNKDFSSE